MRKKAKIFRHFLHANFYLFDETEIALAEATRAISAF